jgi:hypothetical protein
VVLLRSVAAHSRASLAFTAYASFIKTTILLTIVRAKIRPQ